MRPSSVDTTDASAGAGSGGSGSSRIGIGPGGPGLHATVAVDAGRGAATSGPPPLRGRPTAAARWVVTLATITSTCPSVRSPATHAAAVTGQGAEPSPDPQRMGGGLVGPPEVVPDPRRHRRRPIRLPIAPVVELGEGQDELGAEHRTLLGDLDHRVALSGDHQGLDGVARVRRPSRPSYTSSIPQTLPESDRLQVPTSHRVRGAQRMTQALDDERTADHRRRCHDPRAAPERHGGDGRGTGRRSSGASSARGRPIPSRWPSSRWAEPSSAGWITTSGTGCLPTSATSGTRCSANSAAAATPPGRSPSCCTTSRSMASTAPLTVLIDPANERSLALAERLGFTPVGEVEGSRLLRRPIALDP